MYPFDRHERLRRDVSAHADGELSPRDAARVEAHLPTCEDCRALLDGLRMASAAVGGLPAAEAPRSFALTPDMAGAPSPSLTGRAAPAYNNGLRLAAAGLALALAVVMVADRANFGGEGDSQGSQVQGLDERSSDTLGAATENAFEADAPPANATSGYQADAGAEPKSSAGAADATGVPAAPTGEPLDDTQARASAAPEFAAGGTDGTNDLETESESQGAADATADRDAAVSDNVDALTIVEVVLGALLAATLIGLALAWAARRRRSV